MYFVFKIHFVAGASPGKSVWGALKRGRGAHGIEAPEAWLDPGDP